MPSRCISHRRINDGPSPVNSDVLQAGMARCSTMSTGRSAASPIPMSLSTTESRTMTKPAKSNRTGTLPCVRVISDDLILAAAPAALEVAAVVRREALLLLPVLRQARARLPREAQVPAVEELLLHHRSFSAAT